MSDENKEARVVLYEKIKANEIKIKALEKKLKHDYNKLFWIKMIPYKEWFWGLKMFVEEQIAELRNMIVKIQDIASQKRVEIRDELNELKAIETVSLDTIKIISKDYKDIKEVLRDMIETKKENSEKHLAELVDDPQIEAKFIKACEKQIEDAKRQLEKLDSKVGSASERESLDRKTEKKEDEEREYYKRLREYAEIEKECLEGEKEEKKASGGNGIDKIKICPKCGAYYKDTHTSTECAYHNGEEASGGELITIEEAIKQGKIVEKIPEPIKECRNCKHDLYKSKICLDCDDSYDKFEPKEKTEPEKKYPKVVYQLGSDSKEYVELKEKYDKLIEEFKDKLEFLRDKVLDAPIISGSVQDLRDHIHDIKDLVIKTIKEYEGG